jgi:hypothetical protein
LKKIGSAETVILRDRPTQHKRAIEIVVVRSPKSLADKFWIAAGCLYAATFIFWYIYERHELFFPPEATVYDADFVFRLTPLLGANWWDYACIAMFVIASSFAITAFRLRTGDF